MSNLIAAHIDNWFTYHPPTADQIPTYEQIRTAGREVAHLINNLVPDSDEKELALDALRQAVMWANAGVACNSGGDVASSADQRPHSRACGYAAHEHGSACARDCPTCST